jgi:BirA family biotin operon repressor/biotin-[acetyl-CoA-carboxylase] ligase
MTVEQLSSGWIPQRVGRRIIVLPDTESTNTLALAAADEPENDGLAIFADAQTAGRGRLGAAWLSPRAAGVLCSILLLENGDAASFDVSSWLTHVSAVAACEAIRQAVAVTPAIKWPNDLRIAGKKLGGILIETRPVKHERRAWVIGLGINCLQHAGHFPPELRETATSLELVTNHPVDRTTVARELLKALDKRLGPKAWGRTDDVHHEWLTYAEPLGQKVRLRRDGRDYTGWTVEVDPVGGLLVRLESGRVEWFDPMHTKLL